MSFSSGAKHELAGVIPAARHCRIAELAAMEACILTVHAQKRADGKLQAEGRLRSENREVCKKFFTLFQKTITIRKGISEFSENMLRNGSCRFTAAGDDGTWMPLLTVTKVIREDGSLKNPEDGVSALLLKNDCCRRSYLRGMYLCIGSMSDPGKEYHLEFVCPRIQLADQICSVLAQESIPARTVRRRKQYVVYLKDSTAIIDLLNMMDADVSLMNMENSRILKEIANSVNRRVNCETSNLQKTVNASGKQIEAIRYIRDHGGFGQLPENVRQTAELRLEHETASLQELGELSDPPVGRSGINHRLRRLTEIAEELREKDRRSPAGK
ncbi:MAG: DNA-binding protein WhiA [Lachnospiraceae bacterium]|nr:DNA-binding protein WhiA [Lachnospiraceae bacterium]